jgi:uncharacterized protein (DUF849 family)
MEEHKINLDWAICAFGKEEMSCLEKAVSLGGKLRVGFENSLFMPNGEDCIQTTTSKLMLLINYFN